MRRISSSISRTGSGIGYEFIASSGFDYNYDPVDGRALQSPSKGQQFDPYSDDYPPSDDLPSSSQVTEPDLQPEPYSYKLPAPTFRPLKARSHTPTPISSPSTSPSPSYILESNKPSIPLASPASSRKLLILDLNGTLVFRSPHRPRATRRPYRQYNNGHSNDPYSAFDPNTARPLRTVHARPYMPSFASYLFHPTTRTWLDTMVWSSAQPHSVADMVSRCFGERKDELVAIWARDTLGLEEKDYHRKTQTTKDLAKPWAALPLRPLADSDTPTPSAPSSPSPSESQATAQAQAHSAHTTLLLDDSPLKAHLQPWNHLCIREYDADRRSCDLSIQEQEHQNAKLRSCEENINADSERPSSSSSSQASSEHADDSDDVKGNKKRKRPKKGKKSKSKMLQIAEADFSVGTSASKKYDQTLLAVIGILGTLKYQSNVASWIREGQVRVRSPTTPISATPPSATPEVVPSPVLANVNGESTEHKHDAKRRRESDEGTSTGVFLPSSPSPSSPSSPSSFSSVPGLGTFINKPTPIQSNASSDAQWFEDPEIVTYWAERGLKALDELGIEVVAGVNGASAGAEG